MEIEWTYGVKEVEKLISWENEEMPKNFINFNPKLFN